MPPEFRYGLLRKQVMKVSPDEDPAAFLDASPLEHVSPDAPPTFVIHGDRDTLAPVEYARLLVEQMQDAGAHVAYSELRGAQHAFDVFASPRTVRTVAAVERFLAAVRTQHSEAGSPSSDATS
jgi:acetyl esterase/lipase